MEHINLDALNLTGNQWTLLLISNSTDEDNKVLSSQCNWDVFTSSDIVKLLSLKPQYKKYCNLKEVTVHDWGFLVAAQPKFKINRDNWLNSRY